MYGHSQEGDNDNDANVLNIVYGLLEYICKKASGHPIGVGDKLIWYHEKVEGKE